MKHTLTAALSCFALAVSRVVFSFELSLAGSSVVAFSRVFREFLSLLDSGLLGSKSSSMPSSRLLPLEPAAVCTGRLYNKKQVSNSLRTD